jgi:hypothetical protein
MSRRSLPWVLLFVAWLSVAVDAGLGAPPKKKNPPPPPAAAQDDPEETKDKPAMESTKLKWGNYRGTMLTTPNAGGLFRVTVEYDRVRVKRGKEAEYDRLQKESVAQAAKATSSQARAATRAQLSPVYRWGTWIPDRANISNSVGMAVGAATQFEGNSALLRGLLETVADTQEVIFHAGPTMEVIPLGGADPAPGETKSRKIKSRESWKELKVGQHVRLTLATDPSRDAIYKRIVTRVIVEEEAPGT